MAQTSLRQRMLVTNILWVSSSTGTAVSQAAGPADSRQRVPRPPRYRRPATPGVAATRPSKRERTLAALLESGLDLFERQGYEQTTVAEIARAAGVTEMTFFRYFPAKEHLLLDDPYDPVLIEAIARAAPRFRTAPARRPRHPLGMAGAARARDADHPPARAHRRRHAGPARGDVAIHRQHRAGDRRAAGRRRRAPDVARVAAASVLAALVAGLFIWAEDERRSLAEAIERALDVIEVAA